MGVRCASLLGALSALLFSAGAVAVDPQLDWRTLRTQHFNIHFHPGAERLAARVADVAEQVHQRLSRRLEWQPHGRTEVVLSDEASLPNGFATPLPFNQMQLYPVIPDDIQGLEESDDWLELLFTHEYTHVLHLDRAEGAPAGLRRLFGRDLLLFPNALQPGWITEGLATYMESDLLRGVGRGQSDYYRMLMRMEVARGLKPLRQINLPLRSWPAGTARYLYGVYFFRYLEREYGADAIAGFISSYSDNLIPFRIYSNPRSQFGMDLDSLWLGFALDLDREFRAELEEIRRAGVVQGEPVADAGEYGGMLRAAADGSLYHIHDDGQRRPRLRRWRDGVVEELARLRKGARLDLHDSSGALITQPEFCGEYRIYYDLYRYREESGRLQRLTRCARIRWAAWGPDGKRIAALQAHLDGPRLLLLDGEGGILRELWRGTPDQQISHPDWVPDGSSIVAACWQRGSGWSLCLFELQRGEWRTLLADGSVVGQPQFSTDGRHLLFVSSHGGIYNLRRMDLHSGAVVTMTRVEGGAFYPVQGVPGGAIHYLNFGPGGQRLYRLARPLATALPVAAHSRGVAAPVIGARQVDSSPYSPWPSLRPRHWLPHLVLSPEVVELGFTTSGQDALGIHSYLLGTAWESVGGSLLGLFDYRYSNRLSLQASRYNDYYLDGSEQLQRARRRDALVAEIAFPHSHVDYHWNLRLGVASEGERDAWRRDTVTVWPATRDNLAGLLLQFDSSRRFIHSVSRSEGRNIGLVVESSDLLPGSDYSGSILTADWREYLSLGGQQVLALRLALGWGTDQPRPFRLGGAGGALDMIATAGPRLNQRNFALRGYPPGLQRLQGRRMLLASLEWRFPLSLIERGWMVPPVGLQQWSGLLFVDSGAAWQRGSSPDGWSIGAGAELLTDINLFYLLDLRLRIGYAHGFAEGGGGRLYMVLGSSF